MQTSWLGHNDIITRMSLKSTKKRVEGTYFRYTFFWVYNIEVMDAQ